MTDFNAIDALLAGAKKEVPLPPAEERRALREELNLSRTQLAQALGVSPSTVGGWESGRDPSGEVREKYAYFLEGARTKLAAEAEAEAESETATETEDVASAEEPESDAPGDADQDDDVEVLAAPRPCVLCGQPARHQVTGFPQHLDPAECGTAEPPQPEKPAPHQAATRTAPAGRPQQPTRGVKVVPVGRRMQTADTPDLIARAVTAALAEHSGDVAAATTALVKRAIPDAMALLDESRKGGRYDVVAHPWLPDVLRKQTARGPDQVWEARPKWSRPELPHGEHEVTALDINGAYLSALKTHLPLGQLEHSTGDHHDRRRAGIHLITPPVWDHDTCLPNPIGSRDEPGPLWVTEPTLRLLLRLSGPKYGLCEPPEIHESWTSGATEGLLEKFRVALKDARDRAIAEDDEVTLEYVKAMYSKFVSTMGESNYNRELYRTDWMHLIRSQAFVNLWWKAHRAYDEGLMVVRAMGTDELHVIGDWRAVFPEGRAVTEVKVKDTYTVGASTTAE
ncbi:helix-turn-helix transcriptional regulator [Streptomyces sp. NBC_00201]|uniref:helix-turn-helix domain-containing protein n=1 Tax=unclassified Streptomyces TaxID=2593676 RepID=UPI00224CC1EE|nr:MULTISPECIES: helix-turn-helix transcriptional regulator [unclassified Streptomyces]MCX5251553.1 helix-turn-helix transcriptional regulator [Streptomyces sp. NBC_00201]MCX5294523.1 helix-turn-helix transcriptional regulator [Streptomyces sp. NBC_00183]